MRLRENRAASAKGIGRTHGLTLGQTRSTRSEDRGASIERVRLRSAEAFDPKNDAAVLRRHELAVFRQFLVGRVASAVVVDGFGMTVPFRGQTIGLDSLADHVHADVLDASLRQVEVVRIARAHVRVSFDLELADVGRVLQDLDDLIQKTGRIGQNDVFVRREMDRIEDDDLVVFAEGRGATFARISAGRIRAFVQTIGCPVFVLVLFRATIVLDGAFFFGAFVL